MIKDNANYISVKDLAELVDINEKTVIREIKKSKLTALKFGRIYRIHKKDALVWLEEKEYVTGVKDEDDR